MIKVITADDHALIRKGIRHILEKTADIRIVAEAEDGRQLLKKLRTQKPDVVIMDLSMPGMDAFDLIREVQAIAVGTPILVLSMHPEEYQGVRMLKAGAAGYINKSGGLNELVAAIRRVHRGKRFISDTLADKLADGLSDTETGLPHEQLSEREFQVLSLIASGKTATEISNQLCLSVKTVSTYRSRLLDKMDMHNNAQLTYYAIQHRLV